MRYLVLAADYDGTIARDGKVAPATVAALERLAATGRKLVLVTGRELDELLAVFPRLDLFDRVVAENGALLYDPATREARALGAPPPHDVRRRRCERRGVAPLSVGRVDRRHLGAARDAPCSRRSASWASSCRSSSTRARSWCCRRASTRRPASRPRSPSSGLSPHNVVGDRRRRERPRASCAKLRVRRRGGERAADAQGARRPRQRATTAGARCVELIEDLIARRPRADAAARVAPPPARSARATTATAVAPADGTASSVLVAGPRAAASRRSRTGSLERLRRSRATSSASSIPRATTPTLDDAVVLGTAERAADRRRGARRARAAGRERRRQPARRWPSSDRAGVLRRPAAALCGAARAHRPAALDRGRRGAPPAARVVEAAARSLLARRTARSDLRHRRIPSGRAARAGAVDTVRRGRRRAGRDARREFCDAPRRVAAPARRRRPAPRPGEALVWRRGAPRGAVPASASRRARRSSAATPRKYAEGELPPDRSFYFRGPDGKLNLRAQNLALFLQIADGVDDETWLHHLGQRRLLALVPRGDQGRRARGPCRRSGARRTTWRARRRGRACGRRSRSTTRCRRRARSTDEASALAFALRPPRDGDVAAGRPAGDVRRRRAGGACLAGDRAAVRIQRHVAARDQYRHDHRDLPDGVPDPEHAEPRHLRAADQARRADSRHVGTRTMRCSISRSSTKSELDRICAQYRALARAARADVARGLADTDVRDIPHLDETAREEEKG